MYKGIFTLLIFSAAQIVVAGESQRPGVVAKEMKTTIVELNKAIIEYDENYIHKRGENRKALEPIAYMIRALPDSELNKQGTETPLMLAAQRGMAEVTRILVTNGALPDVKDKDGCDALWFAQHACKRGQCKKVAETIKDSHRKMEVKRTLRKRKSIETDPYGRPVMHMPA